MPSTVFFLDLRKKHRENHLTLWDRMLTATGGLGLVSKTMSCAVKVHFGEDGNLNYLNPQFSRVLIERIRSAGGRAFLTDTTTLYSGRRFRADTHLELARDHGFDFAPVIIADGLNGDEFYEIDGLKYGRAYERVSTFFFLSHFKGHMVTSFGGALKNIAMGCASKGGKLDMHAHDKPEVDAKRCTFCLRCYAYCAFRAVDKGEKTVKIDRDRCTGCGGCLPVCPERAIRHSWSAAATDVTERLAKYAAAFYRTKKAFFYNFLLRISPECDCFHTNEPLIAPDIGILAGADPVAVDQASLDFIRDPIMKAHPDLDPDVQLASAERFGAGERAYEIKNI